MVIQRDDLMVKKVIILHTVGVILRWQQSSLVQAVYELAVIAIDFSELNFICKK